MDLCKSTMSKEEVEGKTILEVGSRDVNGSFRTTLEELNPKEYLGVDIEMGSGVDRVLNVYDLDELKQFDIVVCTEAIEHIEDWRKAITNLMKVLKIGGTMLLTSRSKGFGKHDFPNDYWRYEIEDIESIFKEFEIILLCEDEYEPLGRPDPPGGVSIGGIYPPDIINYGFFLKAKKINNNIPDFSEHCLYNINTDPKAGLWDNNIQRTLNQ